MRTANWREDVRYQRPRRETWVAAEFIADRRVGVAGMKIDGVVRGVQASTPSRMELAKARRAGTSSSP